MTITVHDAICALDVVSDSDSSPAAFSKSYRKLYNFIKEVEQERKGMPQTPALFKPYEEERGGNMC